MMVKMKYTSLIFLLIFLSLLPGCSVGPRYIPPCINVPNNWKNIQEECESCDSYYSNVYVENWWQIFNDEKLNELETLAQENNRNLFVAWQRIEEARGLMGIAASDFYPHIYLNPQYTNTGELIKNYRNSNIPSNSILSMISTAPFRAHEFLYFLPLNASYEVDLWGKIQDQYDAARYHWEGQNEDFEFVLLGLTTDLAAAYFQLRAADAQIDLLLATLKTRQKAFEINSARYDEKITFYASVTQAGEEVDVVLTQYYEVVRQRGVLENLIAVLLGFPASEFCLEHMPLKDLPPCIPEGIPSEVLLRRPDIAEAEFSVRSQHALVKHAYSQFFPSLTLTATVGFESPTFKEFLKWISRYWMIGANANQYVFDGFKLSSNLDLQIARFMEASGTYQQTVLTAFQEVEDALVNLDYYAKQYKSTEATTRWAQKTYELYLDRYKAGLTYYIDVVNTERDLLNYQVNLIELLGFRYIATIQMIKSLGGGYD